MKKASLILTETEFCAWLDQGAPGDAIEYHRGFLALDCVLQGQLASPCEIAKIAGLARCALKAAEQRRVHLVQHRRGDNDYSYFAIARPFPRDATLPSAFIGSIREDA